MESTSLGSDQSNQSSADDKSDNKLNTANETLPQPLLQSNTETMTSSLELTDSIEIISAPSMSQSPMADSQAETISSGDAPALNPLATSFIPSFESSIAPLLTKPKDDVEEIKDDIMISQTVEILEPVLPDSKSRGGSPALQTGNNEPEKPAVELSNDDIEDDDADEDADDAEVEKMVSNAGANLVPIRDEDAASIDSFLTTGTESPVILSMPGSEDGRRTPKTGSGNSSGFEMISSGERSPVEDPPAVFPTGEEETVDRASATIVASELLIEVNPREDQDSIVEASAKEITIMEAKETNEAADTDCSEADSASPQVVPAETPAAIVEVLETEVVVPVESGVVEAVPVSVVEEVVEIAASKPTDTFLPETVASETVAPEIVAAETVTPGIVAAETVAPETVATETVTPETAAAETVTPEIDAAETVAPETVVTETVAPEAVAAETVAPETVSSPVKDPLEVTPVESSITASASVDVFASHESASVTEDAAVSEDVGSKEGEEEPKKEEPKKEEPKEVEWEDILGSGTLMKKTVIESEEGERPTVGQVVKIMTEGKLEDGTQIDLNEKLEFTIGDHDVIQALEIVTRLLHVGEVAEVKTDPKFAYGKLGRAPEVPPNAHIHYVIALLEISPPFEYGNMPPLDRLIHGLGKKERGNVLFKREEFSQAIIGYSKAVKILDADSGGSGDSSGSPSDLQKLLDEKMKVYNNLAATQMKLLAYDSAINSCDKVLKVQPNNVKALFRKGQALESKKDSTEALVYYKRSLKLDPNSKRIKQEVDRLSKLAKKEENKEKKLYAKMLGTSEPAKSEAKKDSVVGKFAHWFGSWALAVAGTAALVGFTVIAVKSLS